MQRNKKAFTLIELLVVVLIIGILATIAVPQYQKAVFKSKVAKIWPALKSVDQAVTAYCLANPDGTPTSNNLDISVPQGIGVSLLSCSAYKENPYAVYARSYMDNTSNIDGVKIAVGMRDGKRYCGTERASTTPEKALKLCQSWVGLSITMSQPLSDFTCGQISRNCYVER